jgi:mRNA-degrading endonuclease YafQ of YafQ-DinJ toxin-antitoxin module
LQVEYSKLFTKTSKKLIKKGVVTDDMITKAITLFLKNEHHPSLDFKHIMCKNEKHFYQIRINKNYRIFLVFKEELITFVRVASHDEASIINKNC